MNAVGSAYETDSACAADKDVERGTWKFLSQLEVEYLPNRSFNDQISLRRVTHTLFYRDCLYVSITYVYTIVFAWFPELQQL